MAIENRSKTHLEVTESVASGADGSETGNVIDAAGNATHKYNDTDDGSVASADAETFLVTGLASVKDVATVQITSNDSSVGVGNFVSVVEATPASESDFVSGYQSNAVKITLADLANDTEIGDDTDISGLDFTYTVKRG